MADLPAQTIHPIDPNTKRFTSGWYTWFTDTATQLGSTSSPVITDGDFVTDGIMTRTAAGTYTSRTITGTADKITITNGDGDAGNPTITIATGYVGQSSITTVGTITSGTWTGTAIAVANGGTGSTSASDARTALGLAIGTNVQAYDADLSTIAGLSDPNADRILFWDDSAGSYAYLTAGTGLTITGTTIDASASGGLTEYTSASASGPGSLYFAEDTDNGSNKVTITVASSLAADYTVTLPSTTDTLVGKATTDTLTNKTINADATGNVITNIGSSEVKSELISGMSSVSAATGDTVLIGDASDSNNLKKCTVDSIAALASGSYVKISSQTASSSAAITFTGLSSTYEAYKIIITDSLPVNDGIELRMRTSANNGSSYDSGASDYRYMFSAVPSDTGTYNNQRSTGADYIRLIDANPSQGNASTETANFEITLFNPSASTYTRVQYQGSYLSPTSVLVTVIGGAAERASAAAVDAIQFYQETGNIASGTFTLYGIVA